MSENIDRPFSFGPAFNPKMPFFRFLEGDGTDGSDGAGATVYTPPASQEELDRIIGQRLARKTAEFSDYDDLKAKATQFDALEDQNKTDLQKEKDRADAAELRATNAVLAADRANIASTKGVPAALLTGSTKAEMEASADALVTFRGTPGAGVVPSAGTGGGADATAPSVTSGRERALAQKK